MIQNPTNCERGRNRPIWVSDLRNSPLIGLSRFLIYEQPDLGQNPKCRLGVYLADFARGQLQLPNPRQPAFHQARAFRAAVPWGSQKSKTGAHSARLRSAALHSGRAPCIVHLALLAAPSASWCPLRLAAGILRLPGCEHLHRFSPAGVRTGASIPAGLQPERQPRTRHGARAKTIGGGLSRASILNRQSRCT